MPTNRGDVWVAGKVGIGTRSPGAKLDINGTVNANDYRKNGNPFPILSCIKVESSGNCGPGVQCHSGYTVTGGGGHVWYKSGCNTTPMALSTHDGNGWRCRTEAGENCYKTRAICCKIQ